jgi:glycine betaine catabolism B
MQTIISDVIGLKQETPTVKTIKLEKNNLDFKPGQYMMVELDTGDDENIHPLSIASSPTEEFLLFSTKNSESSFKRKFSALKVEDKVKIKGPMGIFVLKEDAKNIVFLSGGIGVTPFRGMIKYGTDKKLQVKMTLLYSNRAPDEICYKDEWASMENQNPNLKVVNTITDETPEWNGKKGRISEEMIKEHCNDFENTLFYICGPPGMVDGLSQLLKSMNIPQQNIKVEKFAGY